ncbi:MAG TPA: ABC transporter permease [Candidatus Saccharimonadales bacterium]|nr:ABC transporter permease [Candidatus Saccharimonadales bacterium]
MITHVFSKKNRALLAELVRTDFKLRYQGSILGYTWSLLRPLLLFVILYVVFVKFLKIGGNIPHYPIYLLLGIVLWSFFGEMTSISLSSIVGRGDLIRKIRIPRWIIVLSSSVTATINLGLNLLIVVVFMFFNHVDLLRTSLWFPLILVQLYIVALGVSLFLAAAYVKYRDMSYIWEVCIQILFYLTPILYPLSNIKNVTMQKVLLLNPAATAIQDARYALVTHDSPTISSVFGGQIHHIWPYALTIVALLIGVLYFKKEAKYFAENL